MVEIKGVQFVNKGAELMLLAVLDQLAEMAPKASVALRPNKNSPYAKRAALQTYQKLTLTKSVFDFNFLSYWLPSSLRRWMKAKWGIVTEADIDVILDASGFAYGDQWSSVSLAQLASELKRFDKKGKSYVFLPQALGPFTRGVDRRRLKSSMSKARLILARDETSYNNVQSLGVGEQRLRQFPDFTNLLKGKRPDYFTDQDAVLLIIPNSKMMSAKNKNQKWASSYRDLLSDAIEIGFDLGLTPTLLNHEGKADRELCDFLVQRCTRDIQLIEEEDPIKVKGIIQHSRLVLSSRFHGCVSALSQGVACVGTSWSYKYRHLFEEYDRGAYLIQDPLSNSELQKLLFDALNSDGAPEIERIQELKSRSLAMWNLVGERLFGNQLMRIAG